MPFHPVGTGKTGAVLTFTMKDGRQITVSTFEQVYSLWSTGEVVGLESPRDLLHQITALAGMKGVPDLHTDKTAKDWIRQNANLDDQALTVAKTLGLLPEEGMLGDPGGGAAAAQAQAERAQAARDAENES